MYEHLKSNEKHICNIYVDNMGANILNGHAKLILDTTQKRLEL
jgi:hypothetical protein